MKKRLLYEKQEKRYRFLEENTEWRKDYYVALQAVKNNFQTLRFYIGENLRSDRELMGVFRLNADIRFFEYLQTNNLLCNLSSTPQNLTIYGGVMCGSLYKFWTVT